MEYKIDLPKFMDDYLETESKINKISVQTVIVEDLIKRYEKNKSELLCSIDMYLDQFPYSTLWKLHDFLVKGENRELLKEYLNKKI